MGGHHQQYGHGGGGQQQQQWGGPAPPMGGYYPSGAGYGQPGMGQPPTNWAAVASMYTPHGSAPAHLEPTDEEMSWLEAEMAAASGQSGGGGGSPPNEGELTDEEWAMLEAEMERQAFPDDELDLADVDPNSVLTEEEMGWLQNEIAAGEQAQDAEEREMEAMFHGMSMGQEASRGPAAAAAVAAAAAPTTEVDSATSVADLVKASADVECCVCMERVLDKPAPSSRRFGLLNRWVRRNPVLC